MVSLRDQTDPAVLGAGQGTLLKLSHESAEYIRKIRIAASANGFSPGTQVLDLTGRHPGSVFALGGAALGSPWMISGVSGSVAFAQAVLKRVPCRDLASAWLITPLGKGEPDKSDPWRLLKMNTSTPLPLEVIQSFGLDPGTEYKNVITIESPVGYGPQMLLMPSDIERSRARCETLRDNGG